MKIAYITSNNPFDKHSWSGTSYYTRKCLEKQGHKVYCIFSTHKSTLIERIINRILKLFGKEYLFGRTVKNSKKWATHINKHLEPNTDAIFSLGTVPAACLETNIPIYIYVDCIFEHLRITYGINNLLKFQVKEANLVEQLAINRCKKIISCSIDSGEAIKKYYKNSDNKLEIVPLGANWDNSPKEESVNEYIENRSKDICKLLFVGVDWERKGADIVIKTTEILKRSGFPVELHLCGLKQVPIDLPEYIVNHSFISKSTEEGINKLYKLFSTSHFLFVPSRAEAYGLVFCEASAFGLPSISHKIGGLTTTIKDDINGKLFDVGTSPEVFAEYIKKQFEDYTTYIELSKSSFKRYNEYLNWDVSGRTLTEIMLSN